MNCIIIFGRKNSKSLKNKNITKILGKPSCLYPIEAAIKSKKTDKVFVSTDSKEIMKFAKNLKCEILHRPKFLATDKALLSDAIFYSVEQVKKKYNIKNIGILLCNSVCVTDKIIDNAFAKINQKNVDTVTTISKLNMYSPIRAFKINSGYLQNFIPNKTISKYAPLSGDRNKSIDSYFSTHACTVSKIKIFNKKKNNPMPFNWMGPKKKFIIQENVIGDIDFDWQLKATEVWIKKNEKN
jgi:CMP-N-acetylneuraminic acid synthetase